MSSSQPFHDSNMDWHEPAPREPAPSFQDHPGLSRGGVLENMMPLGTPPTARVRAKAKGEPLRKMVQARQLPGSGLTLDEGRSTPDASASGQTRASSLRADEQPRHSPMADNQIDPQLFQNDLNDFFYSSHTSGQSHSPAVDTTMHDMATSAEVEHATQQLFSSLQQSEPRAQVAQMQAPNPTNQQPTQRFTTEMTNPATNTHQHLSTMAPLTSPAPSASTSYPPPSSAIPSGSPFFTAVTLAKRNGHTDIQQPLAFLYSALQKDPELERLLQAACRDNSVENPVYDRDSELGQRIKRVKKNFKAQSLSLYRSPFVGMTALTRQGSSAFVSPSGQNPSSTSHQPSSHHHRFRSSSSSLRHGISASNMSPDGKRATTEGRGPAGQAPSLPRRDSSSSLSSVDSKKMEAPEQSTTRQSSLKRTVEEAGSLLDAGDEAMEAQRKRLRRDFPAPEVRKSNVRKAPPDPPAAIPKPTTRLKFWPPGIRDELEDADEAADGEGPATPTALGRPPSSKKKVAPRTKMSPVKNERRVAIAGIARPETRRRGSPVDDDKSEASDDNDYCSACNGPGYLLCCDGCDRSFHFTCVDPPFDPNATFDSRWYCAECLAQQDTTMRPPIDLFADLKWKMAQTNPKAFMLPERIRHYFKDVQTGSMNEYVSQVEQRSVKGGRIGYDNEHAPDYRKTRDVKGKPILCYRCGKSALGGRDIIPCDYCELNWHLDCLDPPLANPPYRGNFSGVEQKTRAAWRCPVHADHERNAVNPVTRKLGRPSFAPKRAKAHRMRQPVNIRVVPVHMKRGFANSGNIEVESETSDESGFSEVDEQDSLTYRLPRRGIMLDFIDRVKVNRLAQERSQREMAASLALRNEKLERKNNRRLAKDISKRHFDERKAIFNLVQFRDANQDLKLGADELENLMYTLEAEAPSEVSRLMSSSTPSAPSKPPQEFLYGTRSKSKKQPITTVTKPLPSPSPSRAVSEGNGSEGLDEREREILLRMQAQIQYRLGGAKMTAVNGSTTTLNGVNGVNGLNGINGVSGRS